MDEREPDIKYLSLAEKWMNGTITPEEEKEFAEWYNHGQEEPLYVPGAFAAGEDAHRQRILAYILKWKDPETPVRKMRRPIRYYAAAAACLAALLLAFTWFYFHRPDNRSSGGFNNAVAHGDHFIEKVNTSGRPLLITLPDSSTVQVEKGSRIFYSKTYGKDNRDIHLAGGAVFEVRHNPALPFEVYAAGLVTKVLGTKFHVSAYGDSQEVVIAVLQGKVSVSRQSEDALTNADKQAGKAAGYVLNPNQQVLFDPASGEMQKSLVALPATLHKLDPRALQFAATPLRDIFHELGRMYGISIVFDEVSLKNCTLTADLSKGSFYDKLEKICIAANLHYSEMDGHILISGRGCN